VLGDAPADLSLVPTPVSLLCGYDCDVDEHMATVENMATTDAPAGG
jgi:hypothetical protein